MKKAIAILSAVLVTFALFSCSGKKVDERALKDYASAKTLYSEGRFPESKALLQAVIARTPSFHQADLLLAKASLFSGDAESAAKRLEALSSRRGGYREAEIWLLRSYLALGRVKDAETRLLALLEYDQSDPRLFSIAGSVYLEKGEEGKALAYYERAIDYGEDLLRDRFEVARLHYRYAQSERAVTELEAILAQSESGSGLHDAAADLLAVIRKEGANK